jgi:hypothetical protein
MTNVNIDSAAENPKKYKNRGLDIKAEESSRISIGLVDIDTAIIKYMDDVIQPFVTQDELKVSVPILYANPERWKSTRKDGVYRDVKGKLQIPLIMIKRDNIRKNTLNNPVNKYLERDFHSTTWNSRNKYDRFAIQNGIKESKRYVAVMYPDFYDVEYSCMIWTEYQQQMNGLVEQISFEVENYWGETNKYKFKTSVEEYRNSVQLPQGSDRLVRSEFRMTVKAYLLPEITVDKYGNPMDTNMVRFTNKKLVISEKIDSDLGL